MIINNITLIVIHRYRKRLDDIMQAMQRPYIDLQELSNNMIQQDNSIQKDIYSTNYNDDDLAVLCDALRKQREGLEHLTEILRLESR